MELTNEQREIVDPHIPQPVRKQNRGRPRRDNRTILNGILWVLRTGAPWIDPPSRYPPYQTCHRRFQEWMSDGTLTAILTALAKDMEGRGKIKVSDVSSMAPSPALKKGV